MASVRTLPVKRDIEQQVLVCGELKFTAYTMGEGPLVLLLHGFPDSPDSFRLQLRTLAAAGYRAVAVTLRGYEPSSQPKDKSYHVANLARDVIAWVDALGETQAHLVAHDWGASIAYAAAAMAPTRFKSLTAIAVPHPAEFALQAKQDKQQLKRSAYIFLFQLRGIAEWWLARKDWAYIEKLWRTWSPAWQWESTHMQKVKKLFSATGVKQATLTYYRQALDTKSALGRESAELYQRPILVPCLGITGEKDGCIGHELFLRAMPATRFPGGVDICKVANAGHFPHLEAATIVNQRLLNFLNTCEKNFP